MNWKELIKRLSAAGFTQQEIADYVGCSQSLIAMLGKSTRGRSLSYQYAVNLIDMDKKSQMRVLLSRRKAREIAARRMASIAPQDIA